MSFELIGKCILKALPHENVQFSSKQSINNDSEINGDFTTLVDFVKCFNTEGVLNSSSVVRVLSKLVSDFAYFCTDDSLLELFRFFLVCAYIFCSF